MMKNKNILYLIFFIVFGMIGCETQRKVGFIRTESRRKPSVEGFVIRENVEIFANTHRGATVLGTLKIHDRVEILAIPLFNRLF